MKSKYLLIIMLILVLMLFGCTQGQSAANSDALKAKTEIKEGSSENNVISEGENYEITYGNWQYAYRIFDNNKNTVDEGESSREPKIIEVNENLIRFTLQTGTGLGTQWGYYYDCENDKKSETFTCIYDQTYDKVAHGTRNGVIVRDIFDKSKYCLEIKSFTEPLSDIAEPIVDAKFIDEGKSVKVTYLTGSDYKETSEIFEL